MMTYESRHVLGDVERPDLDARTVMGVFDDRQQLKDALDDLHNAGYSPEQILVQGDEPEEVIEMGTEEAHTARRSKVGLALGAVITGALAALTAVLVPGLALVQQLGVPLFVFFGALIGVALGLLYGSFTGLAKRRQNTSAQQPRPSPRTLTLSVKVPADQQLAQAGAIMNKHGAHNVTNYTPTV